jgi:D-alanine-D-alanine ligase
MKRIAVLMGGLSSEREVSLRTGAAVATALRSRGYDVVEIDAGRQVASDLAAASVHAAFIALHGRYGEDGCVQGVCEILGVPYTGSGVLASALAMDKVMAKRAFEAAGLPVPPGIDGRVAELRHQSLASLGLHAPVVVKPRFEGSSVGVSIVRDEAQFLTALEKAGALGPHLLVERFVAGREVCVGVLDGRALGTIEIVAASGFYDYEAKYQRTDTQYISPARLSPAQEAATLEIASRAHVALGCRGVTRADLLVPDAGAAFGDPPVLLEINTLPGMTATSLIPKIARGAGLGFEDLCCALVESARLGT